MGLAVRITAAVLGFGLTETKKQGVECGPNGTILRVGDAQPTYLQSF